MVNPSQKSKALPRGLAIAMVVLAIGFSAWLLIDKFARIPGQVADDLGDAAARNLKAMLTVAREVFTIDPKIVSSTTVIHQGSREAFEIVLAERDQVTDFRYENSWAGSTKVLHVRGVFRVKAGYRPEGDGWFVDQRPDGTFAVNLPPAEVLSCEQLKVDILEDADGFWNKLDKEERSKVHQELLDSARRQAADGDLLARAEQELIRRLGESARRHQLNHAPVVLPIPPAT